MFCRDFFVSSLTIRLKMQKRIVHCTYPLKDLISITVYLYYLFFCSVDYLCTEPKTSLTSYLNLKINSEETGVQKLWTLYFLTLCTAISVNYCNNENSLSREQHKFSDKTDTIDLKTTNINSTLRYWSCIIFHAQRFRNDNDVVFNTNTDNRYHQKPRDFYNYRNITLKSPGGKEQ